MEDKMRARAEELGQNLQVFDLRNLLIEGETEKFLAILEKEPSLASASLDSKNGEILLSVAIRCGNTECAKVLIDSGADVNRFSSLTRESILLEALQAELFDLARYLINSGADYSPKSVGDYGRYLSPKYARDGILSKSEFLSLIETIKNGKDPETNF